MLFLGKTGPVQHCSVHLTNNLLYTNDSKEGFFGYKLDSPHEKNGAFIEWSIHNNHLILSNDTLGFFPLYYTHTADSFSFSSSIADLLTPENCHQLNYPAIAVFLRLGSFIGNTTPFKNISVLAPNTTLQFDKAGLTEKGSKPVPTETATFSLNEAVDIYGELFHKSMHKFSNFFSKKIGVPISGGRDSRHILFELSASGIRPSLCMTMKRIPPQSDEDARIAKEVCTYLDVDHRILNQQLSFLNAEKKKNEITNFCSLEHSWILPLAQLLSTEQYEAIFDGIGGDVLSQSRFLTKNRLELYRKENYEALANDLLGLEHNLRGMLKKSFYNKINRELAVHLLTEEFKQYTNTPNPISQFSFWNRTRRNIALSTWKILAEKSYVFAPYLENNLYKFLSSLPAEILIDRTFHDKTIAKRYPTYSHLPYEKKGTIKKDNLLTITYQTYQLSRYFIASLSNHSMVRPFFLYRRLLRNLLSIAPKFTLFRSSIYLLQLQNLIKEKSSLSQINPPTHQPSLKSVETRPSSITL